MRMWEIREGYGKHREGEYEEGYEKGYRDAMKEYRRYEEEMPRYDRTYR